MAIAAFLSGVLRKVLVDELRQMYLASNERVKSLSIEASRSQSIILKDLLNLQIDKSEIQVSRLKQVFEILGVEPTTEDSNDVGSANGREADALLRDEKTAGSDADATCAASRTEHYMIAWRIVVSELTRVLAMPEISELLSDNDETPGSASKFGRNEAVKNTAVNDQDTMNFRQRE